MANYQLVADVSGWNPDTQAFFNQLAGLGVKAVIVKLTESTNYTNPKAYNQIRRAWKAGLHVHAYHFAHFQNTAQAKAEAKYFANTAKSFGLDKTSVLVADVEASTLPSSGLTGLTNSFLEQLKASGYPKVDLYTMASWIWSSRINPKTLIAKNLWIARYQADKPGVDNVGTWQFTSNYKGLNVDMSYDFKGLYTKI